MQGSTVNRAGQPDCKGGNSCGNVFPPNERVQFTLLRAKGRKGRRGGLARSALERGG